MKLCLDCGLEKPLVKFGRKTNGEAASCNACDVARRTDPVRKYRYQLFSRARRRARLDGKEFTITMQDIDWPEKCPVFGTRFTYKPSREGRDDSCSIDRIDNAVGYVPGNVTVISTKANRMKNSATADELRAFARWVLTEFG